MWFFIDVQNQKISFRSKEYSEEKLLIENEDCYLITVGQLYLNLKKENKITVIRKLVDLYSKFTTFIIFDSLIDYIERSDIFKILKALKKNFSTFYPYEKEDKFEKTSLEVIKNYLIKKDSNFTNGDVFLQPLNNKNLEELVMDDKNKEIIQQHILKSMLANRQFTIIAVNSDEDGKIVSAPFPADQDISDYCNEYNEKHKRNISINFAMKNTYFDILSNEDVKNNIIEYIDFLKYDFLPLYSDNAGQPIKLMKILSQKYVINYLNVAKNIYFLLISTRANEFTLNLINTDDRLLKLKKQIFEVFQLNIKNNVLQPFDESLQSNYVVRIKENIGAAFPTVVNVAQRIIPKGGNVSYIEIIFDECKFIMTHTNKWNDKIHCYI